MEAAEQIDPKQLASEWITKAMSSSEVGVTELSRRSGVSRRSIYNIIQGKQKESCRLDMVVLLVTSCGFTFREFNSIVKSL